MIATAIFFLAFAVFIGTSDIADAIRESNTQTEDEDENDKIQR